jgi:hypothetical protein
MAHFFISYSRQDAEFVDRLIQALEQFGFTTWKDVKAITGGDIWKAAISKAVRECDAFLIVLSPQAASSENVSKELAVATKHDRRILPVMYQACKIPDKMEYDLAELQWADFVGPPFDEALDLLVRAIGGKPTSDTVSTKEVQALREFVNQTNRSTGLASGPPRVGGRPTAGSRPPVGGRPPAPATARNPFCIHCGASVPPGNAFCIECGASL